MANVNLKDGDLVMYHPNNIGKYGDGIRCSEVGNIVEEDGITVIQTEKQTTVLPIETIFRVHMFNDITEIVWLLTLDGKRQSVVFTGATDLIKVDKTGVALFDKRNGSN